MSVMELAKARRALREGRDGKFHQASTEMHLNAESAMLTVSLQTPTIHDVAREVYSAYDQFPFELAQLIASYHARIVPENVWIPLMNFTSMYANLGPPGAYANLIEQGIHEDNCDWWQRAGWPTEVTSVTFDGNRWSPTVVGTTKDGNRGCWTSRGVMDTNGNPDLVLFAQSRDQSFHFQTHT